MAPSKPTRLAARRSLGTSLAHLTVADTPPPLRRSPRTSLTDADDEGEHPVPPTLAPRAAKHRARPPPKYNHTLKDNDHDDHAFAFSTHPPTPATAKRASKRSKPVAPQSDSEDETSPRTPAKISKRAAALPVSHDPTTDGLVGINTSETPVGMRNIALRNGPPASGGGGSARRSSHGADHRAKRGSSIGGGFIAVPHPDVDDSKLYRSTDPTAPPALRLRSLLSWTAQRQRDALFPATPSGGATSDAAPTETRTSRSGKGAPQLTEVQKRFAKGVIEDFIEGICDRSIDVSWDATDPTTAKGKGKKAAPLPPHPQNVLNTQKMEELSGIYAAIAQEDAEREAVLEKYKKLEEEHSKKPVAPPAPAGIKRSFAGNATAMQGFSTSMTNDLEAVLSCGQKLLSGEIGNEEAPEKKKKKARTSTRKGRESEVETPAAGGEESLAASLEKVRLQSSAFAQHAHRLSAHLAISTTYIASRLQTTSAHLASLANTAGMGTVPLSEVYERAEGGRGRVVDALEGVGLGGMIGKGPGVDARDLLRGIAAADGRGR